MDWTGPAGRGPLALSVCVSVHAGPTAKMLRAVVDINVLTGMRWECRLGMTGYEQPTPALRQDSSLSRPTRRIAAHETPNMQSPYCLGTQIWTKHLRFVVVFSLLWSLFKEERYFFFFGGGGGFKITKTGKTKRKEKKTRNGCTLYLAHKYNLSQPLLQMGASHNTVCP